MAGLPDQLLPNRAELPADTDSTAAVREIPTRRAVCLLLDAEGRPVQTLAWANPRAGMKRRLAEPVEGEKTRRVNYGELVRCLLWRGVDSEFESDVIHAAVVRTAFPQRATELLRFPQPWFVHVDPSAEFPRWLRVERPGNRGISIGPLPDRTTANRVIELLEDLFDLCRYYHILLEAPRGKACAYKDMGRCPAPCDGSVPMEQYRRRTANSAGALLQPGELVVETERQMQSAAGQLRFEAAKSLKDRLEKVRQLQQSDLAWAGLAERMAIVSAQPGSERDEIKLFLLNLGGVFEIGRFGQDKLSEAFDAAKRLGNTVGIPTRFQPELLSGWHGQVPLPVALGQDYLPPDQNTGDDIASQAPIAAFDPLALGPAMRHLFGDAKRRSRFCRVEQLSEEWLAERLREWHKDRGHDHPSADPTQAPE